MRKHALLLLLSLLFAIDGRAQQDYSLRLYSHGAVVAEHRCLQTDSITFELQDGVRKILVWKNGQATALPTANIDSISVAKAVE
ncbi:MAG: hypothetical protein IKT26_07095, partial [Bacteroidaceae bacterium]|nr:hypothetical protein [Bacteroidaceae bacterium]